ncbi:hypothetical protein PybrP1_000827 [[Pythium] brassicae (nom. inval.)]|nr:hypothetical protein PybrP1_000827 [[Pythium] brassicae (nom. inval.)]
MSGVKRERMPDGGFELPVQKLPRVAATEDAVAASNDASLPMSPTEAAGILPRASRTPSPAPVSTPAVSVAPESPLAAARERLASASDAHVQARLLQQLSRAAAAPGARTNAAIDFLFSFLQSSQGDGSDGGGVRTGGGPVVVGAIVRGLRELLRVKAAVVEPMIQVDAMGEQLMACVSVAEDFKLRQDMLQIVVDCLMLTRAFAHVEQLLSACVRDHDAAMQAICVRGYVRLLDVGHRLSTDPAALFDLVAALLLHGADDDRVKLWSVRLLTALSDAHPLLETATSFVPSADPSPPPSARSLGSPASSLRDKAFFVLCMAVSGASASVRKEITLSLRAFGGATTRVVEHALQKTQISEELADDADSKTVLMLSSGALLDLLEDKAIEVSLEASKSVAFLAKAAKWSEPTLDRAIAAHVDVLPGSAAKSGTQFFVLAETLEQLLVLRKEQYGAEFSLTSEEMNYIVRDRAVQAEPRLMLPVLRVLVRCDTSTAWMVQRTVEYALLLAEIVDKSPAAAIDGDECTRRLAALAKEVRRKCGAAIRQDVSLVDTLQAALHPASGAKAEVVSVLLNGGSAQPETAARGGAAQLGSRSASALFKFAQARPQAAEIAASALSGLAAEYDRLRGAPSADGVAAGLKSVQRLRAAATGASEAAGLRVLELEIVELASGLYIKESQLGGSARADLLQLVLLARVGLSISHLPRDGDEGEAAVLHWLAGEAAKLEFLHAQSAAAAWLDTAVLRGASSLGDLARGFASALQDAWPAALVRTLSGLQTHLSRATNAVVLEPDASCKEPREIVAHWPFAVRVRSVVEHAGDISCLFVKSVLPNGEVTHSRVPVDRITVTSATRCVVDHRITLTVPPFSDPTSLSVALCVEHPVLPGAVVNLSDCKTDVQASAVAYTAISDTVRVRIVHRPNSTIRRG